MTNIQVQPNTIIAPHVSVGVFKGFLVREYKIPTEKYLQSKTESSIDIIAENGHNRGTRNNIVTEHLRNIIKPNSNTTKTDRNIRKLALVLILDIKL